MELSDCSSSVESSAISIATEESRTNLNLKATELRLGLPGSQSPERDAEFEKPLFQLHPLRDGVSSSSHASFSGNKRGFSDAINALPEGKFISKTDVNVVLSPRPSANLDVSSPLKQCPMVLTAKMDAASPIAVQERAFDANDTSGKHMGTANRGRVPAAKAQVVGWPPIRSFRRNSLAITSKNAGEVDGKARTSVLFVKVSMDGAPYLRKVDLKAYTTYQELSSALEKMFSCFTIGQCTSHVTNGRKSLSESKLKDLVHGSEYVLTYEDKDGDWMLVGDVPWEMFIATCIRLRIMKSTDAIGLAPRAVEKCRSRSRS